MLKQAARAARLDRSVYTELYFDGSAVANALVVVALFSTLLWAGVLIAAESFNLFVLVRGVIGALFGWVVLTFAVFLLGSRVFGGRADFQKLLASTGYAHAPLLLLGPFFLVVSLTGLGGVTTIVVLLLWAWFLVVLAVAVEQTMELPRQQAWLTALLGFAIWAGISVLFGGGVFF